MRVQIPAYTDAWMKGDRYGDVVHSWTIFAKVGARNREIERVRVKLDKSGRTISVDLDDCEVIEDEPIRLPIALWPATNPEDPE